MAKRSSTEQEQSAHDTAQTSNEWLVRAKCTVLKEFTVRGSREAAEALTGEIIEELEIDQLSVDEVKFCRER